MGIVYLAEDADGRDVALKLLRPEIADDPRARARLAREVRALQRVHSDNIARPVDAELDGRGAFVATEFIPGPTLDDAVRARGALHLEAVREIGVVLGETLEEIHAAGIVHRDLKPSNVMMRGARISDLLDYATDGDRLDPVIIDFGIAQAAEDSRLTSTGLMMGTAAYLDPEVVRSNSAGPETDWWAWAALLAFCATGREPFGTGRPDVVFLRADRGDVDVDGLPQELAQWLRDALQPRLANRADPHELIHRLATLSLDPDTTLPAGEDSTAPAAVPANGHAEGAEADDDATAPVGAGVSEHGDDLAERDDVAAHADAPGHGAASPAWGTPSEGQPTAVLDASDLDAADADSAAFDSAAFDPATGDGAGADASADGPRTELLPAHGDAQRTQVLPAYAEEANPTQVMPRVQPDPQVQAVPAEQPEPQPFVAQDGRGHEFRQAEPARQPQQHYQQPYQEAYSQAHQQPAASTPYGYGSYGHNPYAQQQAMAQYPYSPYGMLPAAPPAPSRPGLVWLGIALMTGLGAIAPLTALILFILLNALARTWQRTWLAQERSRARTGQSSTAAAGALALPRFLGALVESILLVIFPVLLALLLVLAVDALASFSGWWVAPAWYGAGATLLVVLLCWVGLSSRTTRAGAHRVMDATAPDRMWTVILTLLLLALLAAVFVTIAARGGAVDMFPIIGEFPVDQWIPWR